MTNLSRIITKAEKMKRRERKLREMTENDEDG